MSCIKVQCPAKINLNLKIVNKREDGFHNIDSVMQTISLYDYLTITVEDFFENKIVLSGNNAEIPYDERNLVYKAAELFLENTSSTSKKIEIYIEKNIPIAAGLAGGSTDAAGTLYGLNEIFSKPLSDAQLHNLCAQLGSDLNVCLKGGCLQTSGRGEKILPIDYKEYNVSLIKPTNLGISAKEAYTKFAYRFANNIGLDTRKNYENDLEWAVIDDYLELQHIKTKYPQAIMTGSGSTYFQLGDGKFSFEAGYWVCNNLKTVSEGVRII